MKKKKKKTVKSSFFSVSFRGLFAEVQGRTKHSTGMSLHKSKAIRMGVCRIVSLLHFQMIFMDTVNSYFTNVTHKADTIDF